MSSLTLHLSRRARLSPSWSALLRRLQMRTNKGGLKQNESKQTNGIRVMGVGGLVHCDKHNDAVYVCVSRGLSAVRCVVCVALPLLLVVFVCVSVCLPIRLCFCNYMCVYLPALSSRVFYTLSLQMEPVCPLQCVFRRLPVSACCSGVSFPLVFLSMPVCVYVLKTPARLRWTSKFFSARPMVLL